MIKISSSCIIKDLRGFYVQKPAKIHKADACSILARIISFKSSGIFTNTKMYLSLSFYRIIMGGGCVNQDLMVCELGGRARARKKKFRKKAVIMLMGVEVWVPRGKGLHRAEIE